MPPQSTACLGLVSGLDTAAVACYGPVPPACASTADTPTQHCTMELQVAQGSEERACMAGAVWDACKANTANNRLQGHCRQDRYCRQQQGRGLGAWGGTDTAAGQQQCTGTAAIHTHSVTTPDPSLLYCTPARYLPPPSPRWHGKHLSMPHEPLSTQLHPCHS